MLDEVPPVVAPPHSAVAGQGPHDLDLQALRADLGMTGRRNRRTGRRQRTGSSWHRRIADGREDRKKALRQVSAADYGKCRAENGKDKMVFPDERTARRAADALNALPGVRDMQEPYRCRRKGMDHFHLRQVCGKLGRRNRPPADGTAVAGEERE